MDIDSEYLSWKRYALCWQLTDMGLQNADLWFSEDLTKEASEAADICFECPVRKKCLEAACDNKESAGIWGGLPITIRNKRGKAHNLSKLVQEPNPYSTEDRESSFYKENLGDSSE